MSSMLAFDHHELDYASSTNQTRMTTMTSDSNEEGPDDATHIVWALWYVFFNELIYYLLTESVFR